MSSIHHGHGGTLTVSGAQVQMNWGWNDLTVSGAAFLPHGSEGLYAPPLSGSINPEAFARIRSFAHIRSLAAPSLPPLPSRRQVILDYILSDVPLGLDTPLGVIADWLEDHGRARDAAFVRGLKE